MDSTNRPASLETKRKAYELFLAAGRSLAEDGQTVRAQTLFELLWTSLTLFVIWADEQQGDEVQEMFRDGLTVNTVSEKFIFNLDVQLVSSVVDAQSDEFLKELTEESE